MVPHPCGVFGLSAPTRTGPLRYLVQSPVASRQSPVASRQSPVAFASPCPGSAVPPPLPSGPLTLCALPRKVFSRWAPQLQGRWRCNPRNHEYMCGVVLPVVTVAYRSGWCFPCAPRVRAGVLRCLAWRGWVDRVRQLPGRHLRSCWRSYKCVPRSGHCLRSR
jgi:hypothetical protein